MAIFNFPFHIAKDKPAVASEVQTNFDSLLTWIMDNLVQKDGSTPPTAPVVLPPGPPSAPDQAANKAYVDAIIPIGIIWEYGGATLPVNWLWCDGTTYSNTAQPRLSQAIGRAFTDAAIPGTSFQVPDKRTRVAIGADAREPAKFGLGVKGGQRNSELQTHAHVVPIHGHGNTFSVSSSGSSNSVWTDHLHDFSTAGAGYHTHGWDAKGFLYNDVGVSGYGLTQDGGGGIRSATWSGDGNHAHSGTTGGVQTAYPNAANHSHAITVSTSISGGVSNAAAFNTTDNGAGTTLIDKNLPPYVAVNYIIYAGTP